MKWGSVKNRKPGMGDGDFFGRGAVEWIDDFS
jgi:hypothetical protein